MTKVETSKPAQPKGVLRRLRNDARGTTLAYMAFAMFPILGMVGAGVDISRAYIVKTRMQQACDAAAIAGRKSMVGTSVTADDKAEAIKFFNFNFAPGTLGSATMDTANDNATNRIKVSATPQGQMEINARTEVPTIIMGIIHPTESGNWQSGKQKMNVEVTCVGEEYFINNDVMLVLDTTGSMASNISTPTGNKSRMEAMRDALKKLYDDLKPAQAALESKNLRLRYGFVQYSTTVNVGKLLYARDTSYLNNPATYYRSSGAFTGPTRNASWFTGTWEGCIEERATDQNMSSSATSISSTAYDMRIDVMPTNTATRWTPYDAASTNISDTGDNVACPRAAKEMAVFTEAEFDAHVDTINNPGGFTYHDIGMMWGVRLLSNQGVFANNNPDSFNNVRVARTIVFMTDGALNTPNSIYSAWGVENWARKIANSSNSGDVTARHASRLQMMCNYAKTQLNADVWAIAVLDPSEAMPSNLTSCANTGQAEKVTDAAGLAAVFKRISDKVGNLRVGR